MALEWKGEAIELPGKEGSVLYSEFSGGKVRYGAIYSVPVDRIVPNPNNPRKTFDEESIKELARSMREVGQLQPLLLVEEQKDGATLYRIVAGERRWRAAKMAGLGSVHAFICRGLTPEQEREIMLVENLQRKDLSPIEEALAYRALLDEHGYTQEKLAEKLGVSQPQIANRLRLLDLPEKVRESISRGIISASHGRALASFKNLPEDLLIKAAEEIERENLPVAKVPGMVKELIHKHGKPLYKSGFMYDSGGPQFDTSGCQSCRHKFMGAHWRFSEVEYPYCLNSLCWMGKQKQALREKVEKARVNVGGQSEIVDTSRLQYWTHYRNWYEGDNYDQTECMSCSKRVLGKDMKRPEREPAIICLDPKCMEAKQKAKSRDEKKKEREAFREEVKKAGELSAKKASHLVNLLPERREVRRLILYTAARILWNVDPAYGRNITRHKWLKERFGWNEDFLKSPSSYRFDQEWRVMIRLLDTLTTEQLLQLIHEWPAVARGIQGLERWLLEEGHGCGENEDFTDPPRKEEVAGEDGFESGEPGGNTAVGA